MSQELAVDKLPHANKKVKNKSNNSLAAFKKSKYLQLLALPGLVYYLLFHYVPMYGVIIAFKKYQINLGIMGSKWVGLTNFIKFFNHPDFWRLIRNTLLINGYLLLFVFPIPIIFALFLNEVRSVWYKKLVQTVSYMPHFISLPAIIGMVFMFLSPVDGALNLFISNLLGIKPISFMTDPKWYRTIYLISEVWANLGWSAIIYIAALSNVNTELYESATIDGATRLELMWHVSLPSIQPTIVVMFLLQIGKMMSLGADKTLLMQNPLTYETSDIISTFVYRRGLEYAEYSFSTAVSVFNSIINIVLLTFSNKMARKFTDNSLW